MKDSIELRLIDCNCNNCIFLCHDSEDNKEYINTKYLLKSGFCWKFNEHQTFISDVCQIETQKCYIDREQALDELLQKSTKLLII